MENGNAEHLKAVLEESLPAAIDQLQRMVAINSFTANPDGVNRLGQVTAEYFGTLGFSTEEVVSTNPEFGRHSVMTRPGRTDAVIAFVSHHDTVFSVEEELANEFAWRESTDAAGQTRYHGPGTVDIKGGTVMMYLVLSALKSVRPDLFDAVTWVLLFNASEERLSNDFGDLVLSRLEPTRTKACLVFEGGGFEEGRRFPLVTARKGMGQYKIRVVGRGAHAGTSHEHGANAITQLAEIVQSIARLTDYERELTFNVGFMRGGLVMNRVPHEAEALVEFRAFDPAVHAEGLISMRSLNGYSTVSAAADGFICDTIVEQLSVMKPWPPNAMTQGLLEIWQAAGESLGYDVVARPRGGLSDGNHTWHHVPTLDALGPAGGWAHSSEASEDGTKEQEFVVRDSFVPKALLNCMALIRLIEG